MTTRFIICLMLGFVPFFLAAQYNPKALEDAEKTIATFKAEDAKFESYFEDAYGYVVFPSIGKGAMGFGGARGAGTTYEQGKAIGKARITQVTWGMQFGGKSYSQMIFFETKEDLERFKENKFEFAAQASAVAVRESAAANLAYREGVAVFTIDKGGLMYEASLGGQKLKFKPFKEAVK